MIYTKAINVNVIRIMHNIADRGTAEKTFTVTLLPKFVCVSYASPLKYPVARKSPVGM